MKTPSHGMEVDLRGGHIVLQGFPALRERGTAPPLLGPCLLWPRSPISATTELLLGFWATVCKTVHPSYAIRQLSVCLYCLSCLFVVSVTLVYCGQTVGRIKMKLGMQVGLGPGHIVSDGDPAHPPQRGTAPPPQFSAHICCGQMAGWIKMVLGMEVGLSSGHFVLDGDLAPSPKFKFSADGYCGETARWIKMPLGMKVGLIPGDSVFDRDPVPHKRGGASSPIFDPFILWPNGWMHQHATWYGGRPQPRGLYALDGDPVPPPQKGGGAPAPNSNFQPMFIVAKRLDGSRCHLA